MSSRYNLIYINSYILISNIYVIGTYARFGYSCSACSNGTTTALSQIPSLSIELSFDLETDTDDDGTLSNGGSATSSVASLGSARISGLDVKISGLTASST